MEPTLLEGAYYGFFALAVIFVMIVRGLEEDA
jgi:hypothetical protein